MNVMRRDLLLNSLKTVAVVQFLRLSIATKAYAAAVAPEIEAWQTELEVIARDFRSNSLTYPQWHAAIETLNQNVPLADLLRLISFEEIRPRLAALRRGEHFKKIVLPSITDIGRPFSSSIFSVTPGDHIPPHGHNNLVTAHLIVQGQLRTRTFERLHDVEGRVTVKPRRDEVLSVGTTVTMSDEIENVHWFTAQHEHAFSFQISATVSHTTHHVNMEDQGGRVYLDLRGKPLRDGTIEAPVIDEDESHRLYGA